MTKRWQRLIAAAAGLWLVAPLPVRAADGDPFAAIKPSGIVNPWNMPLQASLGIPLTSLGPTTYHTFAGPTGSGLTRRTVEQTPTHFTVTTETVAGTIAATGPQDIVLVVAVSPANRGLATTALTQVADGLLTATTNNQVAVLSSQQSTADTLTTTRLTAGDGQTFTASPTALKAIFLPVNQTPAVDSAFQVAAALLQNETLGARPLAAKRILVLTDVTAGVRAGPPITNGASAAQPLEQDPMLASPLPRRDVVALHGADAFVLSGGGGETLIASDSDALRNAVNQLLAPAFAPIINATWHDQLTPAFNIITGATVTAPTLTWFRLDANGVTQPRQPPSYSAATLTTVGSTLTAPDLTLASTPTYRDGVRVTYTVDVTPPYKDNLLHLINTGTELTIPQPAPWALYYAPVAAKRTASVMTLNITVTISPLLTEWQLPMPDARYVLRTTQPGATTYVETSLIFSSATIAKTNDLTRYVNAQPVQYKVLAAGMPDYTTQMTPDPIDNALTQPSVTVVLLPKLTTLSWEVPKLPNGGAATVTVIRNGQLTREFDSTDGQLTVELPAGQYQVTPAAPPGFTGDTQSLTLTGDVEKNTLIQNPIDLPTALTVSLKPFTLTGDADWAKATLTKAGQVLEPSDDSFADLTPGTYVLTSGTTSGTFTINADGSVTSRGALRVAATLTAGAAPNQLRLTQVPSSTSTPVLPATGGTGGLAILGGLSLLGLGLIQRRNHA
ncbi:vWA domain-containing protein [Lacticaseibacillus parakribbianus]|uniref:vWA domain-containing protein n=1 Tax=Lacticaseibacillus parakribbianus TaxID=2970927 RepID=UPI0021CB54EC|nr:vWA domain-containing protein [Lacticaseibacillus parakribbianus]